MNSIQRILGIFTSPTETCENINQKPDWVVPLIILLVVTMLFTYLTAPFVLEDTMAKQQEKLVEKGLSQEQIDNAMAIQQKMTLNFGWIFGGIGVAVVLLISTLILKFAGSVVLSGKANFRNLFSMYTYASLIGVVGMLIKLPLAISQKTHDVHFSIASFLSADQSKTFLYNFLKMFDLFAIWQYVVVAIGFAVIYRFSKEKAGWTVAVIFLIYSAIAAYLASTFA